MRAVAPVPTVSPLRRRHDVLAASNKRKRGGSHTPPSSLLVRGRGVLSKHSTESGASSPPESAFNRRTAAIDAQTGDLIRLLSAQQSLQPQPAPRPPHFSSPPQQVARPPSPSPRTRSPLPSPTTARPLLATSSPAPHSPRELSQLPCPDSASLPSPLPPPSPAPPQPPPVALVSVSAACVHSVAATSPSAPKSTIASYIHRFRTQPPLDESERQARLQQHHERPQRDFWWLKRHTAGDTERDRRAMREEGKPSSGELNVASAGVAERTETAARGSRGRLSILPAIEAVLSEEERRVTAELARWAQPTQFMADVSAQPRPVLSDPQATPEPSRPGIPIDASHYPHPTPQPPLVAPTRLLGPVSFLSTVAPSTAAPTLSQPPLPQQHHSAPQTQLPLHSAVHADSTAPVSAATSAHRDNILRLARELRLPGLSNIAARDLPAAVPHPQASEHWTAAPLADSYSLIPRTLEQWSSPPSARVLGVSSLLAASTASSASSSQAATVVSSRAATDDDVDVDDILAQWRRTHQPRQAQHTPQARAAESASSRQPRGAEAKEADGSANEADRSAKAESVVEQVVDAVMKRLKEERGDDKPTATAHTAAEPAAPRGTEERSSEPSQLHSEVQPTNRSGSGTTTPAPAPLTKWRDRKKSLSLQLPPRPQRSNTRPPSSSPTVDAAQPSSNTAPTAAAHAGSLKPQQTQWVPPARATAAADDQSSNNVSAHTVLPPSEPALPSPPRPATSAASPSSLLTGALSAVVGRALTCPAPSFASQVHSAMAANTLPRAASGSSQQLRLEDLEDEPVAAQTATGLVDKQAEAASHASEAQMDGKLLAEDGAGSPVLMEASALSSVTCPPASASTEASSLPVAFSPVGPTQPPPRSTATAAVSGLPAPMASTALSASVPPAALSSSFAYLSLSASSSNTADATWPRANLHTSTLSMAVSPSPSSQTALQVQLAPTQPPSYPLFTLPAHVAALYAMAAHSTQASTPVPVFIPVVVSAAPLPLSQAAAIAQSPALAASAPLHPPSPHAPPAQTQPPPSRPSTTAAAAVHAVAPVDLEAELAELLSSLRVSTSLFADQPQLQCVVTRMQQLQGRPVGA